MSTAPTAAPPAPVDPQDLRDEKARLDQANIRRERNESYLREDEARLAAALLRVNEAKTRLDYPVSIREELIQAAEKRPAMLSTNTKANRNAAQRFRDALRDAQLTVFPSLPPTSSLEHTIQKLDERILSLNQDLEYQKNTLSRLEQDIVDANARVEKQKQVVADQRQEVLFLKGNRMLASEFFELPFQDPVSRSEEDGKDVHPSSSTKRRKNVKFYFAKDIRDWSDFNPNNLYGFIGDATKTVKVLNKKAVRVMFDSELAFGEYLVGPFESTIDVLAELFPDLDFMHLDRGSNKAKLPGSVDANLSYKKISRATMQWMHHLVEFHEASTVSQLMMNGAPQTDNVRINNIINSTVQVYSCMVCGTAEKYGCASNWNQWLFYKRECDPTTGNEVLYVTRIYHRDEVRLALAYWLYLVAMERDTVVPNIDATSLGKVPDWLKDDDNSGGSGGAQPLSTIIIPALNTTTPLIFVHPFTILSDSRKSQTRLLNVNGSQIVAKFVNYLGTPTHTDWGEDDLIELEKTEAKTYKHLEHLQGTVIPRYIHCGSDFNFFWVTVTSYEGVSLQRLVDEQGFLPLNVRLAAKTSLHAIHEAGILHGDIALRNVVRRDDFAVLWVDFEMSIIRGMDGEKFIKGATNEMASLDELWHDIPSSPPPKSAVEIPAYSSSTATTVASSPTSPVVKRGKLYDGD